MAFQKLENSMFPKKTVLFGKHVMEQFDLDVNGNGFILFNADFISEQDASALFKRFQETIVWQQRQVRVFGKKIDQPRLVAWFGPKEYRYSGLTLSKNECTPYLQKMILRLNDFSGFRLNSVLFNFYRNGDDCVGWHSDDEAGLSPNIISLSLGAARVFQIKSKIEPKRTFEILLPSGSILVMNGSMQKDFLHQVPKRKNTGPRINLTFREMY